MIEPYLAFAKVIAIDICLSGDNAVVIAIAASKLSAEKRKKAIAIGTLCAIVARIIFSFLAVQIINVKGLALIGGLALLWICFTLLKEEESGSISPRKTLLAAIGQIAIADISMSLDNILAVAGAARHDAKAMMFGLVLSIGIMAIASNYIASLMNRWTWIKYAGITLIAYVAADMIAGSAKEVWGMF